MRIRRTCLTAAALVLLVWPRAAIADFSFLHITDAHVASARNAGALKSFVEALPASGGPAFIVHTGDVTELGTEQEFAAYRDATIGSPAPIYAVPGNHDVRWAPTGKEEFTRFCGPLFRSFDHGGCHFVLLDSTVVLEHWGHFDGGQLSWLRGDLRKLRKGTPVFVFFHHWLGREGTNIDNATELLSILAPYNVVAMFVGHGHSDLAWRVNGIQCFMARGLYQGSHYEVRVRDGTAEVIRHVSSPASSAAVVAALPLTGRPARRLAAEWDDPGREVLARRRLRYRLTEEGRPVRTDRASCALDGKPGLLEPQAGPRDGWFVIEVDVSALAPGWHVLRVSATAHAETYTTDVGFLVQPLGASVRSQWVTQTKSTVQGSAVLSGDMLLVGSFDGRIYALDAATGRPRWQYETGGAVYATPFVSEDTVYVGSMDHYLYALDLRTGRRRWRYDAGSPVLSSASAIGATVCVGSNRSIHGVDAGSGKQKWRLDARSFFQSRVATAGNRFILGGWDNTLYCVDADTGTAAWRVQMGRTNGGRGNLSFYYSPAIASPAVAQGCVYVCTNDGVLHALNLSDGSERWIARAPAGGDTLGYSSPLAGGGRVYVGGLGEKGQGDCYAFDAASGELIWRCSTGADNYDSSPAMVGRLIAIGSVQGRVTWIEPRTGAIVCAFQTRPGYSFSSPVGDGARTFIGSMNGSVTAVTTPVVAEQTKQRSEER